MFKIDKSYCINLDSRPDRWEKMKIQFNKLNIDIERFSALTGSKSEPNPFNKSLGQLGCLKSHCAIIKEAKEKGYKQILILEDDITLCSDFKNRLERYGKDIPANWDSAYLGGTIFNQDPVKISGNIYRNIGTTFGTFAFILKNTIFDDLIKIYESKIYNADNCHAEYIQRKYNSYIYIPFFVHINYDVSDVIENEQLSESLYNRIFKYYKEYGTV